MEPSNPLSSSSKQLNGESKKHNTSSYAHMDLEELIDDLLETPAKIKSKATKISSMEISADKPFVGVEGGVDRKQGKEDSSPYCKIQFT